MSEGYSIFGDINIKKALCITMLRANMEVVMVNDIKYDQRIRIR